MVEVSFEPIFILGCKECARFHKRHCMDGYFNPKTLKQARTLANTGAPGFGLSCICPHLEHGYNWRETIYKERVKAWAGA